MVQSDSNFGFLDKLAPDLARLGRLAESYFQDDPSTALFKLRQFGEYLTKSHAGRAGIEFDPTEAQVELLKRLKVERALPDSVLDVLHYLRKHGNAAVHDMSGGHREALAALKMAVQLGVWLVRTTTPDRKFSPAPFRPPPPPQAASAELDAELQRLRAVRDAALSSAERAEEEKQAALLKAETAHERHQREIEERKTWEALAQDADRQLQALIAQGQQQTGAEKVAFLAAAADAASVIDLDEQATRALIDQKLRDRLSCRASRTRRSAFSREPRRLRQRQCGLQGDCTEAWLFARQPACLVPAGRT